MSFSKHTNCEECNHPLILKVKSIFWDNDCQSIVFECPSCGKDNIITSCLFRNNHISKAFISIYKENKDHIPVEQLNKIHKHFEECEECKLKIDEVILNEIEEKSILNEKTHKHFNEKSTLVNKELTADEISFENQKIKTIYYEDKEYLIDEQFYEEPISNVLKGTREYYYLRLDKCLAGTISLIITEFKIYIDRIWLRPIDIINKEQQFFENFKNGNIKLSTIKKLIKEYYKLLRVKL